MNNKSQTEISSLREMEELLSDQELADWLAWAITVDAQSPTEEESDMDLQILREYAKHQSPPVRKAAIEYLLYEASITWEDLEAWALDPDEEVRTLVIDDNMGSNNTELGKFCRTDKKRFVDLLARAVEQYEDYTAGRVLRSVSAEDDELLELVWSAAEYLIGLDDPGVNTIVWVNLVEHIVPDHNWGPDDPHVRRWIESDNPTGKILLLDAADYLHLKGGKWREITEALTHDSDPEIASCARQILVANPVKAEPKNQSHKKPRKGHRK